MIANKIKTQIHRIRAIAWARRNGFLENGNGWKNKRLWLLLVTSLGQEGAVAVLNLPVDQAKKIVKRGDAEAARLLAEQKPKESSREKRAARIPKDFCDSDAWKRLRYQALKKYGARCMCCGATRADGVQIHVDHVKPKSKYPELALSLSNLQILCEPCNIGKGAWDETDWREKPPSEREVV